LSNQGKCYWKSAIRKRYSSLQN